MGGRVTKQEAETLRKEGIKLGRELERKHVEAAIRLAENAERKAEAERKRAEAVLKRVAEVEQENRELKELLKKQN